jgi:predicted hydrocarbon binding protein
MSAASSSTDQQPRGYVLPALPLALLECVRAHDRPGEVLEDEDLAVSLPRRLGLTGVVHAQIQRYETARDSGKKVPVSELTSLLQLVLRRPDAEAILRETGQRVARRPARGLASLRLSAIRAMPRGMVFMAIRRAARRLLRGLVGDARVAIEGKPLVVRIRQSPTARVDTTACVLYTGALEELIEVYSGKPREVLHPRCSARGDDLCEWSAAES